MYNEILGASLCLYLYMCLFICLCICFCICISIGLPLLQADGILVAIQWHNCRHPAEDIFTTTAMDHPTLLLSQLSQQQSTQVSQQCLAPVSFSGILLAFRLVAQ